MCGESKWAHGGLAAGMGATRPPLSPHRASAGSGSLHVELMGSQALPSTPAG